MIKKILFLLLIPFLGFSQNIDDLFYEKGEIYFSFEYIFNTLLFFTFSNELFYIEYSALFEVNCMHSSLVVKPKILAKQQAANPSVF